MTSERLAYYFTKHHEMLLGYAFNILRSNAYKEDVVSDVFVKLGRAEDEGEMSVKTFLITGVKNKCLNVLKHNQRVSAAHKKIEESLDEEWVDAQQIKSEVLSVIENCIEELPIGQRTVFRMRYVDGMKPLDICDKLGIKLGTLNVQINKAKRNLRELLKTQYTKQ